MANNLEIDDSDSTNSDFDCLDTNDVLLGEEHNDQNSFGSSDIDLSTLSNGESDSDIEPSSEEDSSLVDIHEQITWTDNFTDINLHLFTKLSGPRLPAYFDTASSGPLQYFQLFFTDTVFDTILTNTNMYAKYVHERKRIVNPTYHDSKWTEDMAVEELKAYFGLCIVFGLNNLPRYKNYWSSNPFIGNQAVKKVLTCRRYEKITEFLHVSDRYAEPRRGSPDYDKLFKVRWLWDELDKTFKEYMSPSKEQTIDEGMVGFKGRCSFLQYMPAKPVKRGLKIWIRCDAESGYAQQMSVYLGKGGGSASPNGVYFDIVDELTKPLRGGYYNIFMDNLYTSIPLLKFLYTQNIYSCGTIRQNRKFLPPTVRKPGKMVRGEHKTYQDSKLPNLTVTVWQDTKQVRFASTLSKPDLLVNTFRRISATHVQVNQPHCAAQYSRFMGGVDRFDQQRSSYTVGRPAKKYWKYLLWFLVNSSIVNAWVLYMKTSTRNNRKKYEQIDFRLELAEALIAGYSCRQKSVQLPRFIGPMATENVAYHENVHMGAKRVKRCYGHSTYYPDEKRKCTAYGCKQCGIHLCKLCHAKVHSN